MKRIFAAIAMWTFAAGVIAADAHDHAEQAAKPPAAEKGMHEHMKKMRAQMAQIRAATDPKERERLISEHMSTMEQSMSKMQGMTGCGKM